MRKFPTGSPPLAAAMSLSEAILDFETYLPCASSVLLLSRSFAVGQAHLYDVHSTQ